MTAAPSFPRARRQGALGRRATPALLTLLALGAALAAGGCWDRLEINDVAMVEGVGFDAAPGGGIAMTVNVVLPSGFPGGGGAGAGGGGGSGPAIAVLTAQGATVAAADAVMQEAVPGYIFWGQTRVVIVGAALARQGIQPLVDFILRERVSRPLARIFVTRGQAGTLMQHSIPFRPINTDNIAENMRLRLQPDMPAYTVGQQLVASGGSFLIPEVELQQTPPPGASGSGGDGGAGGQSGGSDQKTISAPTQYRIAGAGLFKQGRLVGWMSAQAARGALWLLGKATRGTVTVRTHEGATVTMQLDAAHIVRKAVVHNGRPTVVIHIVAVDALRAVQGPTLRLDRPAIVTELGRMLAQSILDRAELALQQARGMGVDPFGFRRLLAAYAPKAWRAMAPTWPDGFAQVPVEIDVKGVVRSTGNLINAPVPGAAQRQAAP